MARADGRLGERIVERARDLGFALAGIVDASPTAHREHVMGWLAQGRAGEMEYLKKHLKARLDPAEFVPGCRSLILIADQYESRSASEAPLKPGHGRIARYAQGRDYHDVTKNRLRALGNELALEHPGERFRSFVDTAPILEREHAARAGLGWIGKHTLLIHPRRGSWMFLGGIATTLSIPVPRDQKEIEDHCGTCTRCIDACPTSAITPYSVDASRCIAYLTIEQRSIIDPAFHRGIGEWIYGCDICQDVCPHNSPRTPPHDHVPVGSANPAYASERSSFDLLEVLGWTEDDRLRVLTGTSMPRATLAMWKRNALIAAGNAVRTNPNAALLDRIGAIAADETEHDMVRATARLVLDSLKNPE